MGTGKVVRYDEARGYGFIAPDSGGEDVFVHANMFGADRGALAPGVAVEYEATDSDRGPKALTVRILSHDGPPTAPGPASLAPGNGDGTERPTDDDHCDILSERALVTEVTEALLARTPDLTAGQVVAVRRVMVELANRHGWSQGS